MKIMKEIFNDIPEYKGLYQVSNMGNVKSLKFGKERILRPGIARGYFYVVLAKNKKAKIFRIHQLVAMAFLNHKPCGYKLVVNHKNFIRNDNRVENLEIVTARENANQKHLKKTSEYTGVSWNKNTKKWRSNVLCICSVRFETLNLT